MISGCCLMISVGADQGRGEEASVFGTEGGPRGGEPALPLDSGGEKLQMITTTSTWDGPSSQ